MRGMESTTSQPDTHPAKAGAVENRDALDERFGTALSG